MAGGSDVSGERSVPPAREKRRRAEVERLDAELLSAIGGGWDDPLDEAEFDRLAREVFAHQLRFNPVYRQFCLLRGVSAPADVRSWREIPPVPTGAFKVGRWATFPPELEAAAFRTSGTTAGAAGVHYFETLALYNASIVAASRRNLVPDVERLRALFLSPAPAVAPDSSLIHMFAVLREAFGEAGSAFLLTARPADGAFAPDDVAGALDAAARSGEPVLVAGAALAFHHVLAGLGDLTWRLPAGSRSLVTGGFKGMSSVADPDALVEEIRRRLGIGRERQVEEYGMTELSTPFYDARLAPQAGGRGQRGFVPPPWTRARVVDPLSGVDLPPGEEGAIVLLDLANRASAVAVQTSDLGTLSTRGTFTLVGRAAGAEARGCSLAAELWLEQA